MHAGSASGSTVWRRASVERADRLPAPPLARRRLHRTCRALLRPLFRAGFGMHASGLEQLPAHGPYILASNHVSMLDWAFLSYYLPDLVRFVVHREYWDHPLIGIGLRFNGAIPLRTGVPDAAAFRLARAVLAEGEPLIMFPEGAISRSGRPQRGQPGIIALAAAARVPIVPVALRGAFEAFPRHRRLPRPRSVHLAIGAPLAPPSPLDRAAQRTLAAGLMHHIGALLDGVDAPPPW
jgi:1-acyl-sn-glycerol-3-phosphate acyltransferase